MTDQRPPWDPDPRYVVPPEPVRVPDGSSTRSAAGCLVGLVLIAVSAVAGGALLGALVDLVLRAFELVP